MKNMAKRFCKPQAPTIFDHSELKTNLGQGNFIFVGSSNDLFAANIPPEWVFKTLEHCEKFDNKYFFQSKNPKGFHRLLAHPVAAKSVICTTLESDLFYLDVMGNAPDIIDRCLAVVEFAEFSGSMERYVTIEPIMDFTLERFVRFVRMCAPKQVNIGADSGHNHLPEPPKEKIIELIAALEEFTTVKKKSNLNRILK
jgi:hypothetical protein